MADEVKFGKRFKLCRILAGHDTLAEASEATGISKGAISSYENDRRMPTSPAIIAMARGYDVSADFLLGITDTTEHDGRVISV